MDTEARGGSRRVEEVGQRLGEAARGSSKEKSGGGGWLPVRESTQKMRGGQGAQGTKRRRI